MAKQPASKPPSVAQKGVQQPSIGDRLGEVNQSISIELGSAETAVHTMLEWAEGSLIELDRVAGGPVEVNVNGVPFFRGEVVTVGEYFAVRITEIIAED